MPAYQRALAHSETEIGARPRPEHAQHLPRAPAPARALMTCHPKPMLPPQVRAPPLYVRRPPRASPVPEAGRRGGRPAAASEPASVCQPGRVLPAWAGRLPPGLQCNLVLSRPHTFSAAGNPSAVFHINPGLQAINSPVLLRPFPTTTVSLAGFSLFYSILQHPTCCHPCPALLIDCSLPGILW